MWSVLRNKHGIALAVALFALVVVGALVAGAFLAGLQEQRLGENQRRIHTAFSVAETGAQLSLRLGYPDDSVMIIPDLPAPDGIGRYGGHIYKVGPSLFLIDITGRDTAGLGGASQRIGLIARLGPSDTGPKLVPIRSRGWSYLY
jgi:hypothetical protein